MNTNPISQLITWAPDRTFAAVFEIGYQAFLSHAGIDGLAKIEGDRLEVLAVVSVAPGSFRRFIALAKLEFSQVIVWEVWNPIAENALLRYDFRPYTRIEPDGEVLKGLAWSRQAQAALDQLRERAPPAKSLRRAA